MTIDYAFVPQYVGKFNIEPITFSVFNLATKKYEQIKVGGYAVNVAKGSGTSGREVSQNNDILFVKKGDLSLMSGNYIIVNSVWYLIAYLLPLVAFVLVLFFYRKLIKQRANVALMKTKKANKVANRRLKTARSLMAKNKRDEFYEELLRAIWGYLSDKLTIPVSELNRDNIKSELEKYGADNASTESVIATLDQCEFARYSSMNDDSDMATVYNEACELINKIENVKKK